MLYSDLVKDNSGIYTLLLNRLSNSDISKISNSYVKATDLDARFLFENGEKDCLFNDLNNAVSVLIAKYYQKWSVLINDFITGKLANGASQVTEQTGTGKVTNNISAYDSSDLVPDNGSDTNTNNETTIYDIDGVNFILTTYKNNIVYDTINTDIRRTLFQNVYSLEKSENNEN